jgi:predicted Zn-dependent protease with MMP-like domain
VDAAIERVANPGGLKTERGVILFELCRFSEARQDLEAAVRFDSRDAKAHYTLAVIAERMRDPVEAARRFKLAAAADPAGFPLPVELSAEAFDAAVEDALGELPAEVTAHLSNVAVVVEDVPAEDDLLACHPPLSPTILGMFRGSAIGERASSDPWSHFPASIVLYQRNLERFSTDRDELVEQIRITVLHEVGHFVGLDEAQLRDRGLE